MSRRDDRRERAMERAAIRRGRRIERVLRRTGKDEEAKQIDAVLDSEDGQLFFTTGVIEIFYGESAEVMESWGDGELFSKFLEFLSQIDWEQVVELIMAIIEIILGVL